MRKILLFVVLSTAILQYSCKDEAQKTTVSVEKKNVKVPAFSSDSAYAFIEKQLSFGTRVPGTPPHKECKKWIIASLEKYGAKVTLQDFKADFQNLKNIPSTNIIGQINPGHSKRILLAAHWDTRAIADKDPDKALKSKPIPGADDGGSGVAVLLEIARLLSENPIDMGVDFVFFDAEDQGDTGDSCVNSCSWCVGSQYWANNLIPKKYNPDYGILLDMVGAKNASFYKEGHSRLHAGEQTDKIWTLASRMGYSDYFIDQRVHQITDDHKYVNQIAKIPMLDIINMKPEMKNQTFHKDWHTHGDDIDIIDKRTLRVIGQVVTAVLYKESGNSL